MIDICLSFIEEVEDVLGSLVDQYWSEADERKDVDKPSIDMNTYKTLEQLGFLVLVTAFDDDKLVGFMPVIETPCSHTGKIKALAEILFVLPEYRGNGIAADMIKFAETITKGKQVYFTLKTYLPHNSLVTKLGYQHVENIYMKVL